MRASALRLRGWDDARLKEEHWRPHHDWAGREFYAMAVDLRGFYLKVAWKQLSQALRGTAFFAAPSSLYVTHRKAVKM